MKKGAPMNKGLLGQISEEGPYTYYRRTTTVGNSFKREKRSRRDVGREGLSLQRIENKDGGFDSPSKKKTYLFERLTDQAKREENSEMSERKKKANERSSLSTKKG